jgi:hypothetical protein
VGEDHAGIDAVGTVEFVLDETLDPLDQPGSGRSAGAGGEDLSEWGSCRMSRGYPGKREDPGSICLQKQARLLLSLLAHRTSFR